MSQQGILSDINIPPFWITDWESISVSQALAVNTGYFCVSPGGALSLSLPAVSTEGQTIAVVLDGATSFTITQGALQQVRLGALSTTAGVGGSITSTAQGDTLIMVCRVPNLIWRVVSSIGNPIIV